MFEFFIIFSLSLFSLLLLISCSDLISFYLVIEMHLYVFIFYLVLNVILRFQHKRDWNILLLVHLFQEYFYIACAPFHLWAPDVYKGSLLSSTIIFLIVPKLSFASFFIKWILCLNTVSIREILLICRVLSAFVGTISALNQHKFKKLIIYSSISQIRFIVAGLALNILNCYIKIKTKIKTKGL